MKVRLRQTTFVALLIVSLPLLTANGCTSRQESRPAPARAKKEPHTITTPVQARVEPPKVITSPDSIKISGSQGGDARLTVQQGGYLIKYRYKGNGLKMETSSPLGTLNIVPGGQFSGSDAWTEFEDLTSFPAAGNQQYRITATQPFEIQFVKLPLSGSPEGPPQSYSGRGLTILGPIKLKAGSASFKINCPDLKQAGFIAELFDAATAQNKGIIALGTGASVVETKKVQIPSAGNYLIRINANGRSDWTIEVAQ